MASLKNFPPLLCSSAENKYIKYHMYTGHICSLETCNLPELLIKHFPLTQWHCHQSLVATYSSRLSCRAFKTA